MLTKFKTNNYKIVLTGIKHDLLELTPAKLGSIIPQITRHSGGIGGIHLKFFKENKRGRHW